MDSFLSYQREAEERHQKYEEEHWRKQTEFEEKRRQEDHQHGMRMMTLLGQMLQGQGQSSNYRDYSRQYEFDY